ncbi:putative membrane protein YndD [Alicyclobacillus contaminans]|uniref:spore germination protein n=1 Tax=Alicyclobacillus contaminans TaxID=392016 RepID=UPI00040FA8C5|nr:spore germination protein [Alicyclobacillus contaminans]GMA50317.1 putative membrane protein YndD [Alicyclobacillus contaminans]
MRSTQLVLKHMRTAYDVVVRPVPTSGVEIVYISSIVDLTRVEERLLKPLTMNPLGRWKDVEKWAQSTLQLGEVQVTRDVETTVTKLFDGHAVICFPKGYVVVNVQGLQRRTPEEPAAEMSIRGPRDGFTESLDTNVSQIRSRLRDRKLVLQTFEFGTRTKTKVLLVYLEDLANPGIVEEAVRRLQRVQVDGLLDSGALEQWIEDNPWSPYPQLQSTERPDKTISALLEGRLAILVDGSPFALLAPAVMVSFFQTSDDYSQRWFSGSAIRFVRIFALVLSIFSPSLYIAFTMYNPELLPVNLLLQLAATREGIPLPIVFEAAFMEFMVELVREAGNRMPQQMGQSFSVVGGLVLGDIAVQAGIVSPMMVVVVGLTALGAFAIPNYEAAFVTRMIRFPMLMATSVFGILGTLGFALLVFAHLSALKSFGIPYLTPFAQVAYVDWSDTLLKSPTQWSELRPATYGSPRGWMRRRRYQRRRG